MGLGWLGLLWHVLLPVFRGLEYPFPNLQMQVLWFSFSPLTPLLRPHKWPLGWGEPSPAFL